MAANARAKIIARKRPPPIMALCTVVTAAMMLADAYIRHLTRIGCTCDDRMTLGTTHAPMIPVRELALETILRLNCPRVWSQLMANVTRADLAFRGMTTVTIIVCLVVNRDR